MAVVQGVAVNLAQAGAMGAAGTYANYPGEYLQSEGMLVPHQSLRQWHAIMGLKEAQALASVNPSRPGVFVMPPKNKELLQKLPRDALADITSLEHVGTVLRDRWQAAFQHGHEAQQAQAGHDAWVDLVLLYFGSALGQVMAGDSSVRAERLIEFFRAIDYAETWRFKRWYTWQKFADGEGQTLLIAALVSFQSVLVGTTAPACASSGAKVEAKLGVVPLTQLRDMLAACDVLDSGSRYDQWLRDRSLDRAVFNKRELPGGDSGRGGGGGRGGRGGNGGRSGGRHRTGDGDARV